MPQTFLKDPDATLDYEVDWSDFLVSDTISESDWTVPSGITEVSSSNTTTAATIWVSGGTVGERYSLVNSIVTTEGRADDRTIYIIIEEK